MRSINFYSDLQCTQLIGTAVTQDYDGDEILYAARDSNSSLYAQSRDFEVTIGEEVQSLVTTAFVGASDDSSGQSHSIYLNQTPEIKDTTVEIPIGEPDVYDPDNIEIKQIYVEGGIKLEYVYAIDEVNSTLIFGMWGPRYFTEYVEGQPQFDAVNIIGYNGTSSLLWVGQNGTLTTSITNFHLSTNKLSNFKLIIMEAPVIFFEGGTLTPQDAFIPLLMADFDDEGTTRTLCLSSDPYSTEGAIPYPAAITSNCLTSEEIIPPAPDETGESDGLNRDGTGTGIGLSDIAAELDIDALNRGALNWNGHGYGLTYYAIDLIAFTRDVVGKVYGTMFTNSLDAWGQAVNSVIYPTADSFAINADTIRACIVSAYLLPDIPTQSTRVDNIWVGPLSISQSNALTYYVGDRYQEVDDKWITEVDGHANFSEEGFGDFNDFTNTTATLHLPFIGDIPIDISTISRGDIRVRTVLDQFTGNISYLVYTRSMEANGGRAILYGIYTGNCAVEQPICSIGSSANVLSRIVKKQELMLSVL